MQLEKASLINAVFKILTLREREKKNMPKRKLEINSYHVLEIQTQLTLPETLALG